MTYRNNFYHVRNYVLHIFSFRDNGEFEPLLAKDRKRAPSKQPRRLYSISFGVIAFIFVLYFVYHVNPFRESLPIPKIKEPVIPSVHSVDILIIGAGPAGVSTAWSLYQEAKKRKLDIRITMIEQKPGVGGRLQIMKPTNNITALTPINLEDVATGNLWDNSFLNQASELFDIKLCSKKQDASKVGYWNGEKIVGKLIKPLEGIHWYPWFKLTFKYGLFWYKRVEKLKSLGKLDEGYNTEMTVHSMAELLQSKKLAAFVDTKAYNYITETLGISTRYIHDVLEPQLRGQLGGQNLSELSLLAVSRALNVGDVNKCSEGGLFQRVLEKYLSESKVDLKLDSKVLELKREIREDKSLWKARYQSFGNVVKIEEFDNVIVTGPSNLTDLFGNSGYEQEQNIEYQSTWVTYFVSRDNACITNKHTSFPEEIINIHDPDLPTELLNINGFSFVRNFLEENGNPESSSTGCLYQTLSTTQISNLTLDFAAKHGLIKLRDFEIKKAYPLLYARRVEYGDFKVHDGLWRTGIAEAAGSEVSLSWAAGKTVGKLIMESY